MRARWNGWHHHRGHGDARRRSGLRPAEGRADHWGHRGGRRHPAGAQSGRSGRHPQGRPVNAADIPVGNLPASALTETALATTCRPRRSDLGSRCRPAPHVTHRGTAAPHVRRPAGAALHRAARRRPTLGRPPHRHTARRHATQGLTLNQIVEAAATGTAPALAALTLADLDLTASPLRTSSVAAIALGPTTLDQLPAQDPPEADPFVTTWCPFITGSGLDCADFSGASTIMSIDLAGAPLRTSPLRTSPLRTSDLSSAPLRTSPLRTSDLTASPLRTSPLRTSVLGAATLAAVALDSVPLRTSDLVPSPLRTSPLRTSSPALLATSSTAPAWTARPRRPRRWATPRRSTRRPSCPAQPSAIGLRRSPRRRRHGSCWATSAPTATRRSATSSRSSPRPSPSGMRSSLSSRTRRCSGRRSITTSWRCRASVPRPR